MQDPSMYVIGNQLPRKDASCFIPKYMKMSNLAEDKEQFVLDVGCGSGDVTWEILRPILPKTTRIFAVDLVQDMVTYASVNYPDIWFFHLDISTKVLPKYLEGMFHHVFSFHCLHWVFTPRDAMSNIYKLLKPGGFLFTYFMATHPFFDAFYNTSQLNKWSIYITNPEKYMPIYHKKLGAEESLYKILNDVGFNVFVCEVLPREFHYTHKQLKLSLAGIHPYLCYIPHQFKKEFIDDTEREFFKLIPYQENEVKCNYSIISIVASKKSLINKIFNIKILSFVQSIMNK